MLMLRNGGSKMGSGIVVGRRGGGLGLRATRGISIVTKVRRGRPGQLKPLM
jgi:hypothetical protein